MTSISQHTYHHSPGPTAEQVEAGPRAGWGGERAGSSCVITNLDPGTFSGTVTALLSRNWAGSRDRRTAEWKSRTKEAALLVWD